MKKQNKFIVLILLIVVLIMTGCPTPRNKITTIKKPKITKPQKELLKHSEKVNDETFNITQLSNENKQLLSELRKLVDKLKNERLKDIAETTIKNNNKILESTEDIVRYNSELKELHRTLSNIDLYVTQMEDNYKVIEDQLEAKDKEIAKTIKINKELQHQLDKDTQKQMQARWYWLLGICAILLLAGFGCLVFLPDKKVGAGLIIMSIGTTAVAQFIIQYIIIVSICGGAIFVGIIGLLLHTAYINRQALVDSILTSEHIKNKDWTNDTKIEINNIQSNTSKKLISEIRKKERIGK